MKNEMSRRNACAFIILLGFVSLFADITYEGAHSISGQYLAVLGATGTTVGIVAGLGELFGYGFRLVSGYMSDRTRKYWIFTFVGYAINLLAVPLLALAGNWPMAAGLMVLERFGKALRIPAKDAMLSYAANETGQGLRFGLHQALDQTGAVLGPLLVSYILYFQGSFQVSFALLLIPAICALGVLFVAWILFPHPEKLEITESHMHKEGFTKIYWIYILAISFVAAGYVDFPLIAFNFHKQALIPEVWVPVFFSIAMAAAGISALVCGRLFDKLGLSVLICITAIACLFAPLVFIRGFYLPLIGMVLWGIGVGTHESIMRAVIAKMIHMNKRGTAFGILNIWFGVFWFLGSALMGYLYDISIPYLIAFSVIMQLAAIPLLMIVKGFEGRSTNIPSL